MRKEDEEMIKKYSEFMYNPENVRNCAECPENRGFKNGKPCGQQNCWVTVHCSIDGSMKLPL